MIDMTYHFTSLASVACLSPETPWLPILLLQDVLPPALAAGAWEGRTVRQSPGPCG